MYARTIDRSKARHDAKLAANLIEYSALALRALPAALHHYVAGYSEDGATHRRNLKSFRERAFVPEVLNDVSQRNTATNIFGRKYSLPFGIAPMGFSRLIAKDGDIVLAAAANEAEIPFILSGASLTRMEDVRAAGATSWFQAYIPGEDDRIASLLDRVEAACFDTLVVTVDTAVQGAHELAARYGFRSPVQFGFDLTCQAVSRPRWLWTVVMRDYLSGLRLRFENMDSSQGPFVFSSSLVRDIGRRDVLSWRHLETIRRRWRGKLVVKGLMSPTDARRASTLGVDGVIVSNHGGRQIDCAVSSLDALELIINEKLPITVMYDGGVRRGSDVLKALRLGADFVFVGRPMVQAAAVSGMAGVERAISLLAEEILLNMGLLGIASLTELKRIAIHKVQDYIE